MARGWHWAKAPPRASRTITVCPLDEVLPLKDTLLLAVGLQVRIQVRQAIATKVHCGSALDLMNKIK